MKKILFFAIAVAVTCISCSRIEADETNMHKGEDPVTVTLVGAAINNVDVKTVLGDKEGTSYPVLWQPGDAIVANGIVSNVLTEESINGRSAVFSFNETLSGELSAVSPAVSFEASENTITIPSVQEYAKGSYDPAACIMLGKGTVEAIEFTSAVSFLKITPVGLSANPVSITVESLGSESLSGKFSTDFEKLTLVQGNSVVTVSSTDPISSGEPVIVVIPAQTYANGIQVTIQDASGFSTTRSSTKSFSAIAGTIHSTSIDFSPSFDALSALYLADCPYNTDLSKYAIIGYPVIQHEIDANGNFIFQYYAAQDDTGLYFLAQPDSWTPACFSVNSNGKLILADESTPAIKIASKGYYTITVNPVTRSYSCEPFTPTGTPATHSADCYSADAAFLMAWGFSLETSIGWDWDRWWSSSGALLVNNPDNPWIIENDVVTDGNGISLLVTGSGYAFYWRIHPYGVVYSNSGTDYGVYHTAYTTGVKAHFAIDTAINRYSMKVTEWPE